MGKSILGCCKSEKTSGDDSLNGDELDDVLPGSHCTTQESVNAGKAPKAAVDKATLDKLFTNNDGLENYIDANIEDPRQNVDEQTNLLTFEFSMKLYKTALIWNRVRFQVKKDEMMASRRNYMKENDMDKWREVWLDMRELDEECLKEVLEEILVRVGLTEKKFQESFHYYADDPNRTDAIREAIEDAKIDKGEAEGNEDPLPEKEASMDKKECVAAQKVMLDISLDQVKELKKMAVTEMQNEVQYLQAKIHDRFFMQTGVDYDDLQFNVGKHDFENDEEFVAMMKDYNDKMELLQKS